MPEEVEVSAGEECCNAGNPFDQIRELYTRLALQPENDFGWGKGKVNAQQLGYAPEWLRRLPDVVWESAAAVGNPFSAGPIATGETVVDLGCGAGADACVAALLVGSAGRVYGFDATPAMVAKASTNAKSAGLQNVEFHACDMGAVPLPSAVADVVISNGAINLAQDKAKVFGEVFRILKCNGRFQFADMVKDRGASACPIADGSWADCVSGTMDVDEIQALLQAAGFKDAALVQFTGYRTSPKTIGAIFTARKP